ncbi:phenylacetic acid degradation protein [Mycobacterium intermedium]|uniref:Phenylacetic acid degradation protein n=1 Tax=Mycobacterium intermedium TaxID=28445 RepID=A0A1E3S6A1_MYCIE|nr:1,2-phenylacetyl-CoA epoxidase subunit PaaE [Mycobacterium intermedium]MCV6963612.1 phenylacetate-CoA oxygenase/reductase subunit PaaK [Mycobacterium intermedium]ODQ97614.1 phenylacetic acid degradation protein [Mycobacterium intermedium]OPE46965.1 phenylacetic acid degradation protein [Mycobacterium intermedium]ORB09620.1 phenylacetic acid degradation protein [Mycobacterium intermedium]
MTTLQPSSFHRLRVAAVQPLCDDAAAVTFAVPDALKSEFAFRPGQSVTLRKSADGREHRRCYSICSPAGGALRIGVRELPGGVISGWLVRDVRPGDEVEVQTPSGSFVAPPGKGGRHVLIAAGSGITPILAIATAVLQQPNSHVVMVYGNRRADSVMFADELADLKDRHGSRLELIHVLSREHRVADLFSGRLDAERIRRLLDAFVPVADVDHFWLCGPLGMVLDAQQVLGEYGVPDDRIHRELFFVEEVAPAPVSRTEPGRTGPRSQVTIVLDGHASTLDLPRDTTILDAAQRFRDDLPFACKGGVCGTCRARVTAGEVDMRRNYALDTSELATGFVLTCQSLPTSDTVTLDFDA